MFKVITRNVSEEFERWTDALEAAKTLIPQCKSWLEDIRILDGDELIWIYSRSHTYPQYIGGGTYRRLAMLFLQEAMAEQEAQEAQEAQEETVAASQDGNGAATDRAVND